MISLGWALIFAILSPFIGGLANVIDKYIVSKKVKSATGFTVVAGLVTFIIGVIFALFLNWEGVVIKDILFSAIAGSIVGLHYFFYYWTLQKEDVSSRAGLVYFYPILVAILSFLFLGEVLSLISYIGMAFIILGVVFISLRLKQIKLRASLWMIIVMIVMIALYEFFIKVATINLPPTNGTAINLIFTGVVIMCCLFSSSGRKNFKKEIHNFKWALLCEFMTFLVFLAIYFAMSKLSATIVSSIGVIQPLIILLFEFIFTRYIIKISRDLDFKKKLVSIIMIVIGLILIYLPQILKLIK
jgi:uncharacterized membrane protein